MNFTLFFFVTIVSGLLVSLVWLLRGLGKRSEPRAASGFFEESGPRHIDYFPQIRQAMSPGDFTFLESRGSRRLTRSVRKERRRIAMTYLSFLRQDFQKLLRLARVIAVMSPEVGAAQEFERLRLSLVFSLRYQLIRMKMMLGFAALPELGALSQLVSGLAVRLETAMRELGERAALAAELASSLDRRGMHTA